MAMPPDTPYYMSGVTNDCTISAAYRWAKDHAPAYVYHSGGGLFTVVTLQLEPLQPGQVPFQMDRSGDFVASADEIKVRE